MHCFCSSAGVAEFHGVVGGDNDETIVFQASGADQVRQLCFKAEQLLVWVTLLFFYFFVEKIDIIVKYEVIVKT